MATGRDLRARLKLELRDGVSAGLRPIPGRIERIGAALRRISIAAGVVGGLSLLGPMQQAAAFEDTLRQNAITAGQTGNAVEDMIQRTRLSYEALARETGQRSRDIAQAASSLIAAGLDDAVIQRLLPTIASVATGTAATMEDLARTTFQANQQFGITAEQMPQAFASLIQAGRAGNFELRDMAREFPALLSAAQNFGMRGQGALVSIASALQVVNRNAGSTSQAANNLNRLLSAIASPDVVRNFREMGTDIQGLMRDAARQGINPLEAVVQRVRTLTGGDPFRIGELFGNEQARDAIVALIQHTQDYLGIRDDAARASVDLVAQTQNDRQRGQKTQLEMAAERFEQLFRRLADVVLPPVIQALDALFAGMDRIETAYPGLIDQGIEWTAGLLAAAAAIGAIGQVVSFLGAGLTVLLAPLRLAFVALAAIVGVKIAIFVAAIALIAGAAYLIWKYWDRIGPWFRQLWATIAGWFRGFVDWLSGWASTAYDGAIRIIQGAWNVLVVWFGTLWNSLVREPFIAFVAWVDGWTNGAATMVVEGIKVAWGQLTQWFRDLWAEIQSIFDQVWGPILAAIERVERFFSRGGSGGTAFTPQAQAERGQRMNAAGAQRIPDAEWNAEDAVGPGGRSNWTGRITIELPPGVTAREANTNDPRVTIAPDRGATRSRP